MLKRFYEVQFGISDDNVIVNNDKHIVADDHMYIVNNTDAVI